LDMRRENSRNNGKLFSRERKISFCPLNLSDKTSFLTFLIRTITV
jgi:hypothetical protein